MDDARRVMENALRANPPEIREPYEKQPEDLQEAYGEAMLKLRARKKLVAIMEREDGHDRQLTAEPPCNLQRTYWRYTSPAPLHCPKPRF